MTEKTYNGWTNYETWAVNLWMFNDSGSDEYWREVAQRVAEAARKDGDDAEEAKHTLARIIEEHHDEREPEVEGVFADLLRAALHEVNWYEIAETLITDEASSEFWAARECDGCGEFFAPPADDTAGVLTLCRDCSDVEEDA